ncbi:hypothetical protein HAX54_006334, partial [Datura stramonium]|nr:hypothetical protein [Datura stramonium]
DSMAKPMMQIDLPPEEMMETQRAKAAQQEEEARLDEIARRAEAANFAATLAERNRQNHPCYHGCNV